jgi:FkbM family methyltransferase
MLPALKTLLMKTWFREHTVHASVAGPYRGLRFELSPTLRQSRMCIFHTSYEPEVTELLRKVLIPGTTVFNVGAHIGIHAIYCGRLLQGKGIVYAFEPWPENAAALKRNIELNTGRVSNIVHVNAAVADTVGTHPFSKGQTDGTHHLTDLGEEAAIQVPITTLDAFCQSNRVGPDLMLIDVEGKEIAVLSGASGTIERYRPKLILEHHGAEFRSALMKWLDAANYKVTIIGSRHLYAETPPPG